MTRAHFKFLAKQQLRGKVGTLFLACLLFALTIIGAFAIAGGLMVLLTELLDDTGALIGAILFILIYLLVLVFAMPAFSVGYVRMLQSIVKNPNEKPKSRKIFQGFKYFWGAFKISFLVGLFTNLWSLLFFIPGIIKAFSYSQALYIYAENPEMGALEAITRSRQIMHGRKFDYYVLLLSFYPWFLLLPLTLNILGIWLIPYISLTCMNFYNTNKNVPGHPDYGIPTYGKVMPTSAFMPSFNKPETPVAPVVPETPVVETPVVETPVVETPVVETPVVETPVVETPVVETPVVETPVVEEPVVEEPVVEEPVVEEPVVEEPVVEEPVVEEPVVEEPAVEEPVVEEPVVEEPVVEEPETEETKTEE